MQSNFVFIQIISLLGLVALVVGVTITYAHSRFPGWLALLPTMGAVMLIGAGPQAWINRFFLASRPLVAIGLISYPLYLWHWILLSFAQIWGPIFTGQRLVLVGLSVVLSWLTYLLIEKPLRNNNAIKKKALILILGMLIIFAAALTLNQNGFEQRAINQMNVYETSGQDGGDIGKVEQGCGLSDQSLANFFYGCLQDKREAAQFVIMGDSHAMSLFPGLIRTSSAGGRWLAIYGPGGPQNLRPYLSNARDNVSAQDSLYTDKAVDQISRNPNIQVVLLTFSSNSLLPSMANANERDQEQAFKGFNSIISKLLRSNKKVVLLIDNPHLAQPQDCFHRKVGISALDHFNQISPECTMSIAQFQSIQKKYRKVLNDLAASYPHAVFVFDPTPYLCSESEGVCRYQKGGRSMYAYTDHLSDYAAGLVGTPLNQYVKQLSQRR